MGVKYGYGLSFLTSIVNSLIPAEFKKFIMNEVIKSEQKHSAKRGDEIEETPEFARMFLEPTTYSS